MPVITTERLYKIGDRTPAFGMYLCVPCGYVQSFNAEDIFTTCEACLAGTADGPDGFQEPEAEFWQFLYQRW